jgi:hypothetical protein
MPDHTARSALIRRLARAAAVPGLAALIAAAPAPNPTLAPLGAGRSEPLRAVLGRRPAILMFWRADCGPCLVELRELDRLRAGARPLRVLVVGLQPPAALRPALHRLDLKPGVSWVTLDDPAQILIAYGGAPPRLPLSVAVFGDGEICVRRVGLVGPQLLREWAARCASSTPR